MTVEKLFEVFSSLLSKFTSIEFLELIEVFWNHISTERSLKTNKSFGQKLNHNPPSHSTFPPDCLIYITGTDWDLWPTTNNPLASTKLKNELNSTVSII